MKKNAKLFIGLACLSLGITACSDDGENYTEADKLQNAETALGVKIDPNHDWKMTQDVTASITVNLGMDQQYTVVVYDKNPLFNENVSYFGRTTVAEGQTATMTFSVPSAKNVFYVGAIDSKKQRVLQTVAVENGMIVANFEGANANSRTTRANAVINGDPFTFENTENYYKSEVPSTAKKVDDFVRADWGGQIDTNAMQGATEFYLPEGTYSLHLWTGERDIYVEGNVILNVTDASSINQARIYVLPNATFTLNMSNYINNLEIYVAANATLNYNCEYLYKQTGGGKIYNRGTVNFLKDDFQVNQDAIVYNEGAVYAKNITSAPGTGHPSFFYNFANLTLTGKMVLNSCANFFNEGTVTVAGETNVTQKDIWWINKGHYTTSSMEFSAWNKTFYNYCQLIVMGEAYMHDGQFTLMDNSYTEVGSAKMNNFAVNMGSNTGMYIKGDLRLLGQGDITYQGFRTEGTNDYLLIDGKATVDCHKNTFSISSGITYSINEIEIVRGDEVVTEEQLYSEKSGDLPVLVFNGIGCTYGKLSVIPNTNDCGATWKKDDEEDNSTPKIYTFAFEDTFMGDYDMNDVVLYVSENAEDNTKLDVTLMCTGASFNLVVYFNKKPIFGGTEVHDLLKNGASGKFINTGKEDGEQFFDGTPYTTKVKKPSGDFTISQADFWIKSPQGNIHVGTHYGNGTAPFGIMIPCAWAWPTEWTHIEDAYTSFSGFAANQNSNKDWYESTPVAGTTMAVTRK